ncbi:hypothetical protein HPLT_04915 [Helicobacter pylori Lithuania75]|nr:hypothetical protein HPLT_04915 [Helicobacter pylori Lithuania75]
MGEGFELKRKKSGFIKNFYNQIKCEAIKMLEAFFCNQISKELDVNQAIIL